MPQEASNLCAICGIEKATTRDHIPPKGIFPKPRPHLITVPTCQKCNNDASVNDEAFKVFLSLHAVGKKAFTGDAAESRELFDKLTRPTLEHNKRLTAEIRNQMKPVCVESPGGIKMGEGHKILWDSKAHDAIIERTIRGLYYHHYNEILGSSATCKVQYLKELDNKVYEMSKDFSQNNIGDYLIYKYLRDEDNPLYSIWIFQFYGSHWPSGYTIPVNMP